MAVMVVADTSYVELTLDTAIEGGMVMPIFGEHGWQEGVGPISALSYGVERTWGVIALSLGVSPIMVTLHHIIRIGFTVVAVPLAGRHLMGLRHGEAVQ